MTDTRKVTRGVRNNNPGNIRINKDMLKGKIAPWQGLSDNQTDKEFFQFSTAEFGIRALARTIITYQDQHHLRSVRQHINRWAPPSENDTGAYVNAVASAMNVNADEYLDVFEYDTMQPMVNAIIHHENAGYVYEPLAINRGLALAGILPKEKQVALVPSEPKPIVQTTTARAGTVSLIGGIGSIAAVASEVGDQLREYAWISWVATACAILAIIGGAATIYARIRMRQEAGV